MDLILTQDGSQVSFANRDTTTSLSPALQGTPGFGTDGNPATPSPATQIPSYHYDLVTGSLYNLLLASGTPPSGADYTRLYQAVMALAHMVDTGSANALAAAPAATLLTGLPALSTFPDGFTVRVTPVNTTTSGVPTFAFNGGSAVTVTDPLGNMLMPGAIQRGIPCELMKAGGATPTWLLIRQPAQRLALAANTTVYVNQSTGVDATADGTAARPFKTLQVARNYVFARYDLVGQFTITYNCTGAFTAGALCNGLLAGGFAGCEIFAGQAGCSIAAPGGVCIGAADGADVFVEGTFALSGGIGLEAFSGGYITVASTGVNFGAFTFAAIEMYSGGGVTLQTGFTISGGGQNFIYGQISGTLGGFANGAVAILLTGTPAFSGGFIGLQNGSQALMPSSAFSFSGSATGPRYSLVGTSCLNTNGGGASFLPGSSSGAADATSAYL